MWKLNCGCNPFLLPEIFPDKSKKINKYTNKLPLLENINDIDLLKEKIICEYQDVINKLECGIQSNIENILLEISLINMECNYNINMVKLAKVEKTALDSDSIKHIIITRDDFNNMEDYEDRTIYYIKDN